MATTEPILVTGATGQQGGAVARALVQAGQKVRALTRHPEKGQELTKLGVEVIQGDLLDRPSLDTALRGVKKAFLVTTFAEAGMEAEVKQGITFIDAAKAAGVNHLVYSSVGSADQKTSIPHFETKWKVEQHIRQVAIPYTILRPVFFFENFGSPWMLPAIQQGKLIFPVRPNRKLQMIALQDIGAFAAAAFVRENQFLGHTIELAGDDLTLPGALAFLSLQTGKKIAYEQVPDDQLEKTVGHDFALMFRWFNEVGYQIDIDALKQRWGIPLTSFKEAVSKAPWVQKI